MIGNEDLFERLRATSAGIGGPRSGWHGPRVLASPSQLGSADRCLPYWSLRSAQGIKSAGNEEQFVFGRTLHSLAEAYFRGGWAALGAVAMPPSLSREDRALVQDCWRALTPHLPPLENKPRPEVRFRLDARPWIGRAIAWENLCAIDLVDDFHFADSGLHFYDYKSTKGSKRDRWEYAPTPAKLAEDVQFCLYGASVWQAAGSPAAAVRGHWITVSKVAPVVARAVVVEWRPDNPAIKKWLTLAAQLLDHKAEYAAEFKANGGRRLPVHLLHDKPADPGACWAYGGCEYRSAGICSGVPKGDENK